VLTLLNLAEATESTVRALEALHPRDDHAAPDADELPSFASSFQRDPAAPLPELDR
jgi:hypothetical protein